MNINYNDSFYLETLKKALEIFSPSGEESEIGNFLKDLLIKLGFNNVKKDNIGNVSGEIGSGEPVILLSSHMDTINDKLEVHEDNEKIYGRGAVDAKGPLFSLLFGASKFVDKNLNGKIIFAGIVQEEISTIGIETFLNSISGIDYAIFSEPNNTNNIVVAYKGRSLIKILVESKKGPGHPANAWLFNNSIEAGFRFFQQIKNLCETKYKGRTPYFSVIPTITEFQSAEGKNIIPSKAEFYIDLRYPSGIDVDLLFKDIDKEKLNFIEKNSDFLVKIEILSKVLPYSVNPKLKFIQTLCNSIESILETKCKLTRKTGTSFMNVIGNKFKIPTVSIGPGDPRLEHTKNEYIYKNDFLNGIKIVEKFISNFLGFKD
ncbi:MAG: M20/M25/M40 family metallo-hydrolase [Candidatus Helarchaeota archaeon]